MQVTIWYNKIPGNFSCCKKLMNFFGVFALRLNNPKVAAHPAYA